MSKILHQIAACAPSRTAGTYIYSIIPLGSGGLAAITSADELLVLDAQSLSSPHVTLKNVPTGISCLTKSEQDQNVVICAGRDGVISAFDLRSQTMVVTIEQSESSSRRELLADRLTVGVGRPITALACCNADLAVGTEVTSQQAVVGVW